MAKYCGNCGAQMADDARVCGICGTPFGNIAGKGMKKIPGVEYDSSKKEKRNKFLKKIKVIVIFIVIITIVGMGINLGLSFVGHKGVVRKIMAAYEDYDVNELATMSSEIYYIMEDDYDLEGYWDSCLSNDMFIFENELGTKYKIDYEIVDSYSLPKYKYTDLVDTYEYYENFDRSMLEDVKVVEVSVTAKKDKEDVSINKEIWLNKEGKSWKLLYLK